MCVLHFLGLKSHKVQASVPPPGLYRWQAGKEHAQYRHHLFGPGDFKGNW
jgi:hypothetical protein